MILIYCKSQSSANKDKGGRKKLRPFWSEITVKGHLKVVIKVGRIHGEFISIGIT